MVFSTTRDGPQAQKGSATGILEENCSPIAHGMALSNPLVAKVAGYYGVCSAKERRWLKPTRPAAALTALRQWRDEICALRWQNWDEDRQMLLVRHTLAKGENGGFVLRDNPKDPSGRGAFRDIPVPAMLTAALAGPKRAAMDRLGDFYG